ncbi:hypothetical protein ACFSUK_18705 [Sphingobium scionense]
MRLHRIPVWATLGAERAAHVLLPSRLERLVLLFDRDAAGWKANRQIRLAHQHTGLEVFSPWPPFLIMTGQMCSRTCRARRDDHSNAEICALPRAQGRFHR